MRVHIIVYAAAEAFACLRVLVCACAGMMPCHFSAAVLQCYSATVLQCCECAFRSIPSNCSMCAFRVRGVPRERRSVLGDAAMAGKGQATSSEHAQVAHVCVCVCEKRTCNQAINASIVCLGSVSYLSLSLSLSLTLSLSPSLSLSYKTKPLKLHAIRHMQPAVR